jgi:hypothetical protein
MKQFLRCICWLLCALSISQCTTGELPKYYFDVVMLPRTSEPAWFLPKPDSGIKSQGDMRAAIHRAEQVWYKDRQTHKDPLTRLAQQYAPDGKVDLDVIGVFGKYDEAPAFQIQVRLAVIAPDIPLTVLEQAMPSINDYVYRLLCRELQVTNRLNSRTQ